MKDDQSNITDEELKKALTTGYPFVFKGEQQAISEGRFQEAGLRLSSRAPWILFVMTLTCFIFMANAVSNFYHYMHSFLVYQIILAVLWFWLGIAILYWGMKRYKRLKALGKWLVSKQEK